MNFLSCAWVQRCAAVTGAATSFGSCAYVARKSKATADGISEGVAKGYG